MDNLFYFLTDIATNPKQQLAFVNSPDELMLAFGLSQSEQLIVNSQSSDKVASLFTQDLPQAALICGDPGPDPYPDPDPPANPPEELKPLIV